MQTALKPSQPNELKAVSPTNFFAGILMASKNSKFTRFSLLTPEGQVIRLRPGPKVFALKRFIWEPIKIYGRMIRNKSGNYLKVLYFDCDFTPEDSDLDQSLSWDGHDQSLKMIA